MIGRLLVLLWLGVSCHSCAWRSKKGEQEAKPFGPSGIPPQLRANPEVDGGDAGTAAPEVTVALANHPKVDDIMWTDPDRSDENLPELKKLLSGPKREVWLKNETEAKRVAMREGKCVLIWFTDSVRSPICKRLSEELFGAAEFGDWARDNTVRLIVDQSALMARGEKYDGEVSAQDYVEHMKKKYRAIGTPQVVMLSPQGEVLGRYRGYTKGQADFFWGQLKHAVNVGRSGYEEWLQKLEKQGYRRWEGPDGRTLVARLVSYQRGQMVMVEPDGNRFRTKESYLSKQDQAWLAAEKKKRGIP